MKLLEEGTLPAYRNAKTGKVHVTRPDEWDYKLGMAFCSSVEWYNAPRFLAAVAEVTCTVCARQVAKPEVRAKIAAWMAEMREKYPAGGEG